MEKEKKAIELFEKVKSEVDSSITQLKSSWNTIIDIHNIIKVDGINIFYNLENRIDGAGKALCLLKTQIEKEIEQLKNDCKEQRDVKKHKGDNGN